MFDKWMHVGFYVSMSLKNISYSTYVNLIVLGEPKVVPYDYYTNAVI